jgi:O-antigen/teichoic acid export membrane protein
MVGRFLNFLLVPLYTALFMPEEYGVVTVLYAYVGFFAVLLTYGMETAFFNFARKENSAKSAFATAMHALIFSTMLFVLAGFFLDDQIASWIGYPEHPEYIRMFSLILAFDTLCQLPFALLRKENKAWRFVSIKMLNIAVNVGLNVYFIWWGFHRYEQGITVFLFNPEVRIGYIFYANVFASVITLLAMTPQIVAAIGHFDGALLKRMMRYAIPLVIVGFAGMINELLSRIILKYLLPFGTADFDIGVFGAFYKLSIIITLFVQAFRFAAEPFFFEHASTENSQKTYARVMEYFVAACMGMFLFTALFLDDLAHLVVRSESYYQHPQALNIVPVLLMANVFLGIFYNLSIWYKLTEQTLLGSLVSIGGAVATIFLNLLLVPFFGIMGAAIATLAVYFSMSVAAYVMGRFYYPVPYRLIIILLYVCSGYGLWQLYEYLPLPKAGWTSMVMKMAFLGIFASVVVLVRRAEKKS